MENQQEEVCIISKHTVQPSPRPENKQQRIHLTPWDLKMLSMHYIQKGILFHKPQHQPFSLIISNLLTSFSQALNHFYPLAGRLVTTRNPDGSSISTSLDCSDEGAEFVHASASHTTVSSILDSCYIPSIVHSFFHLKEILGCDGHDCPVLGVQVTELVDGVFIGCSLNHAVADGTSFWQFFNAWSSICRNDTFSLGGEEIGGSRFDRWFPDSSPCPIRLPFTDYRQFITRVEIRPIHECMFHFSSNNIKKLKTKANAEMSSNKISSLQALLAHLWRSVIRVRALKPEQETTYIVYAGYRSRLNPPLPQTYLGNLIMGTPATVLAGEITENGLGWTSRLLNEAVATFSEKRAHDWVRSWVDRPVFTYLNQFKEGNLFTGSSPRFDVYGNDFGWGRPVAVRSGLGSKISGKVTAYPGPEAGSMGLEVCLDEKVLSSLIRDREFMEAVG